MWHTCVKNRDLGAIRPKLDKSCVFHSPTVGRPFEGPDALCIVLESVGEVFGDSLKYHRQWLSPDGRDWSLEFTAEVAGVRIKGLDIVTLTAEGKIITFEVVVRPYKGLGLLKEEMEKLVPQRMAAVAETMTAQASKTPPKSRL